MARKVSTLAALAAASLLGVSVGGCGSSQTPTPPDYTKLTWSNPLPQGNALYAAWRAPAGDTFVVGLKGTILRGNGATWQVMNSGTTADLFGVWGSSVTDVYVVGGDVPAGAQGYDGVIFHYDGSKWTEVRRYPQSGAMQTVWGASATNVFVGAPGGIVYRFDGTTWTAATPGSIQYFEGIWGTSGTNVFAVTNGGEIFHYDGTTWTASATYDQRTWFEKVWGSSASDVYAVGWINDPGLGPEDHFPNVYHFDGTAWSPVDWDGQTSIFSGNSLFGVWGTSASDVYVVGDKGSIFHFDGSNWSEVGPFSGPVNRAVVGGSANDVLVVGDYGELLHWDGASWALQSSELIYNLYSLWGASSTSLFAGGAGVILHFDGTTWTRMTGDELQGYTFGSIWGASATDVYAVGYRFGTPDRGAVFHYDGTAWTAMMEDQVPSPKVVWGASATAVYAAGDDDLVLHYDGAAWTEILGTRRPGGRLYSMWGSSATDVFVAGANGDMLHHGTGSGFGHMNSGTNSHIEGIWGFSSQEVYAVDFDGNLLRYDGSYWQVQARWPGSMFFAIWGTSGSDLYVTTGDSRILHYDGSGFTDLNRRCANMLFSIWGASASDVFFAGEGGSVVRWRP
jgi:hypothetical protein